MADYPLPPNCEKNEILGVVVRESMSMDLLDRLIMNILTIMQQLMETDEMDLSAFQPGASSIEKSHMSKGVNHKHKHLAKRPMKEGVHRSVC